MIMNNLKTKKIAPDLNPTKYTKAVFIKTRVIKFKFSQSNKNL